MKKLRDKKNVKSSILIKGRLAWFIILIIIYYLVGTS